LRESVDAGSGYACRARRPDKAGGFVTRFATCRTHAPPLGLEFAGVAPVKLKTGATVSVRSVVTAALVVVFAAYTVVVFAFLFIALAGHF
jgi:hypothetical protein